MRVLRTRSTMRVSSASRPSQDSDQKQSASRRHRYAQTAPRSSCHAGARVEASVGEFGFRRGEHAAHTAAGAGERLQEVQPRDQPSRQQAADRCRLTG